MEHDTGSGVDPADGSSMPDQERPPRSRESRESEEPRESAEPSGTGATASETQTNTGEPRVDAALRRLDELGDLPVSEHPAVYERVHEQLVEVLGELHQGTQNR
jgi:hypothetical protein